MYGNSAIYCVTFTSEAVARIAAERAKVNPVSIYAPELITKEQLDNTIQEWRERLNQARGLPSGQTGEAVPGVADDIEELWENDEDDDE